MNIREITVRSFYRYLGIFPIQDLAFDHPGKIKIVVVSGENGFIGGNVKTRFSYEHNRNGHPVTIDDNPEYLQMKIDLPSMNPFEKKVIKTEYKKIQYDPRIINPTRLSVIINTRERKAIYSKQIFLNLKTKKDIKKEIHEKLSFYIILLTLLITFITLLITSIPFIRIIQ